MFFLALTVSSASFAGNNNFINKAVNFLNLNVENDVPALVEGLPASVVLDDLSSNVAGYHFKTSLRHSGTVNVSLRPIFARFSLNDNKSPVITLTVFIDVDGVDVDYSEKVRFMSRVKPYFDYATDRVGFYPQSRPLLISENENSLTRQELEASLYKTVTDAISASVKSTYIQGLSNEELERVESHINTLTFTLEGDTYSITIEP